MGMALSSVVMLVRYIYFFIIILIYFEIFKLAYMNPVSETHEGSESSQNGVEVGEDGINKYFLGK